MITLEEARARVLAGCAPLDVSTMALRDARGCVLAQQITADELIPPFDNTAMDGFAVRAADTAGAPVRLRVVATLPAGRAPDREVGPGEAVRIMTGAPMPPGADAVVMVERTQAEDDGDTVVVEIEVEPGNHVRHAGDDLRPGQVVMAPPLVLRPAHLGVLASLGVTDVKVRSRPRVGVVSTGDELVEGPVALEPGQIRDSNRPMLLALVDEAGCVPVDLGIVPDDEDLLAAVLERGVAGCDALVTSGGVSMGDFDYVKAVLDRMGRMAWMQVAIKPAKPLAFGVVAGKPVFGLPGNPVSSSVSFELFARPGLRQLAGHVDLDRPRVAAVADEALRRRPDGKVHFARVEASYGEDDRFHVRSAGGQGSHQLAAMAAANALAVLPDGDGAGEGDLVEAILLSNP